MANSASFRFVVTLADGSHAVETLLGWDTQAEAHAALRRIHRGQPVAPLIGVAGVPRQFAAL